MKPGIVRVDRVYPHDKARVWRAITEPELLAQWLMPNDFEAKVGHQFTFRTEPGPGFDGVIRCEVIDLDSPRAGPPSDREEACMGKEQGALGWLLGRFDRPKNPTEEDTSQ